MDGIKLREARKMNTELTEDREGIDPLSRYLEHVTRLADEKVEEKKTLDHELCRG